MTTDDDSARKNPRRDPSNAFRSVGEDGGLVVVPGQSRVEVLNPVGTLVFSMLDGGHSHDEIVKAIVAEYDVSEEQAREDLESFLQQLESKQLMAKEPGGGDRE